MKSHILTPKIVFYVFVFVFVFILLGNSLKAQFAGVATSGITYQKNHLELEGSFAPSINILDLGAIAGSVMQGTNNHVLRILSFQSLVEDTDLISLSFTTDGTYLTSDIKANGFKLWYNPTANSFAGATQIATSVVVPSTSTMTFSPVGQKVLANTVGYFFVTADISNTAIATRNIRINASVDANFSVVSGVPSVGFPNDGGYQAFINMPQVAVTTPAIAAANVPTSTTNHILYNSLLAVTANNARVTGIKFTTHGTYIATDLQANSFKLWYNSTNNFGTATALSTKAIVNSGSQIDFTGFSQNIPIGGTGYFWLTVDIANNVTATDGNNIGIDALLLTDISFNTLANATGTPTAGGLQTIVVPPDIALTSPTIPAANVPAGTTNHILYQLTTAPTLANAVMTGLSFTTNGTYIASDLQANSFKLWYNTTNNFATATTIGTRAIVASGSPVSFTGLSQSITNGATGYFWLTVDIANNVTATDGNNIGIDAVALANVTFSSGNKTGTPTAGGLQTIVVTPDIALTSLVILPANVPAGTTNHILYQLTTAPTLANAVMTGLSFTTNGTYIASDLQANSFKLWYNTTNNFATAATIGTRAIVASGSPVSFTGLSQSITNGATGYFWLTVDIANNATAIDGHTISIDALTLANATFSSGNKTGTPTTGGLQTIVVTPDIALTSPAIPPANVPAGTTNHILYQLTTAPTLANAVMTGLSFTTNGTYITSDLQANSFKLWYNTTNNFATAATIGTRAIVASGSPVSFTGLSQSITNGATGYFWLTVDIANNATAIDGHTISIDALTLANATFSSGNKTGTPTTGGLQTIVVTPDIALTSPAIPPANVPAGTTNHILYQLTTAPTLANAVMTGLSFTTNGTYITSDLQANSFKLWYNTTNNFATAATIGTRAVVASGSPVSFTGLSQSITNGATGYFWLTVDIANNAAAIDGHTIGINALTLANATFSSGNKTGTPTAGGMQTIVVTPDILLSSPAIPAANVPAGTANHILYQLTTAPTLANAVMTGLSFTTNGTYIASDLQANSLKLWYNTTNNFATAATIGTRAVVASGSPVSFTGLSQSITNGATGYFWLTVDITGNPTATDGNNIGIDALTLANATFISGNKTGTPTAGGLQTISALVVPNILLSSTNIAIASVSAGTINHILYQLTVAPSLSNAILTEIYLTTTGTYTIADLQANSFNLWYNTSNNFTNATLLGSKNIVASGNQINFTGLSQSITNGATGYFWITVDILTSAVDGHTIGINAPSLANILFTSGNKTGSFSAGGLQTIVVTPDITLSSINIATANVPSGTTNHIIYKFTALAVKANTTLNEVGFVTRGTYQVGDLIPNSFKLWQNSTDNFTTATLINTQSINLANSNLTFANLSKSINVNSTQYFWLTADVSNTAIAGNTIQIDCSLNTVLFTSGIKTGTMNTSGMQIFEALPFVAHDILLPNFFSPNGDNQNDKFLLRSTNLQTVKLSVFDRFGNLVYQVNDIQEATQEGWDGGNQPSGIYAWVVQVVFSDGFETSAKGELRLAK